MTTLIDGSFLESHDFASALASSKASSPDGADPCELQSVHQSRLPANTAVLIGIINPLAWQWISEPQIGRSKPLIFHEARRSTSWWQMGTKFHSHSKQHWLVVLRKNAPEELLGNSLAIFCLAEFGTLTSVKSGQSQTSHIHGIHYGPCD